jgi:hypothetical protein
MFFDPEAEGNIFFRSVGKLQVTSNKENENRMENFSSSWFFA